MSIRRELPDEGAGDEQDAGREAGGANLGPTEKDATRLIPLDAGLFARSPAGLHFHIVSSDIVYTESDDPAHERWEDILRWVPAMRGRILADDLTDIFETALKSWTGSALYAAYDLSILQGRYFLIAFDNHMIPQHYRDIMKEQSISWQKRFLIRLEETSQTRRNGDRIRVGVCPEKSRQRSWLH